MIIFLKFFSLKTMCIFLTWIIIRRQIKCTNAATLRFFFSSLDRMIDTDGVTGNALELNKENTVSKK